MSYPEHGANYRHQPKFLDRAMAAEKRADGGSILDDDDDDDGIDTSAGTEVDDDENPEPEPRHRRGTHSKDED